MSSSTLRALGTVGVFSVALAGCSFFGPWPDDRFVSGTEQVTTTERTFRHVQGTAPVESVGVRGSGEDCATAAASTGWTRTQRVLTRTVTQETFGQTRTEHPIQPSADEYGPAEVTVIAEQVREEGRTATEGEMLPLDADPIPVFEEDPTFVSTVARYFGLAGREYLVELFPFDVWTQPAVPPAQDTGFIPFASPHADPSMSISLLTRRDADEGDVWTSFDHRLLYRAGPTETVLLGGGEEVQARSVDVFTTGDADPNGAGLIEACIIERPSTSTGLENPDDLESGLVLTELQRVLLDQHCTGSFRHQRVGTEWWSDEVLVRSETTTWNVEITAFGYEWYVEEGGSCVRMTSTTLPDDVDDAKVFVEYTVTEELGSYLVDAITKGAAEGADEGAADPDADAEEG